MPLNGSLPSAAKGAGRGVGPKSQNPRLTHRVQNQEWPPREKALEKWEGIRLTGDHPLPTWDTTVAEQAVPTSRVQDLVSAAGSFLQRKDAQLAQEWG